MSNEVQRRAAVFLAIFGLGIAAVIAKMGHLQLQQQAALSQVAVEQRTQYLSEPAPRGQILDRDGVPLATNRASNVVIIRYPYYDYTQSPRYQESLTLLADLVAVDLDDLLERVDHKLKERRLFDPLVVKADITPEEYAAVVEYREQLPGVDVVVRPVREYPQKELAAHLVGYVGAVTAEDLEALGDEGYKGSDVVGKTGLERYYERYLRGTPGTRKVQIDYSFAPIGEPNWVERPVPGHNLVLTIDADLQALAERALDWQMFRIQNVFHRNDGKYYSDAKAGAVVVLDVKTGAVLAMASRPAYDLNLWVPTISEADYQTLTASEVSPLWNRAVQASYHPGSTWKMLTASAALTEGVVQPEETVYCDGHYEETNQNDWTPWGHGSENVVTALRDSCNIYFYEMGKRLGIERLVKWAEDFGFGRPTGIDLPNEDPGFLPDAAFRSDAWFLGQTTSAAIGQIFEVTPIQLARYAAALANGGNLLRPHLVDRVLNADGQAVQEVEPQVQGQLPISEETRAHLVEGMKLVNRPGGTSDFARWPLPGIPTAGKTGTAEYVPGDNLGLYVAFAPLDDPEIAIAVVIERSGHGGSVSPVARTIMAGYFGVELPPEDPAFVPPEFPREREAIQEALREKGRYLSPSATRSEETAAEEEGRRGPEETGGAD